MSQIAAAPAHPQLSRRCVGNEVAIESLDVVRRGVLAPPHKLWVEALVAGVADLADLLDRWVDELVSIGRGDVGPLVAMLDRVDGSRSLCRVTRHVRSLGLRRSQVGLGRR